MIEARREVDVAEGLSERDGAFDDGESLGELAGLGVKAVFLEVDEDNEPARRLYNRAGFREVGRRPGYYQKNDGQKATALVLRRDLA